MRLTHKLLLVPTTLWMLACQTEASRTGQEAVDAAARDAGARDAELDDAAPGLDAGQYDGGLIAPQVDLSALREIVRRECALRRYSDGFTIEPAPVVPGVTCWGIDCAPSIACTRPQDCGGSPFARCLGVADGVCVDGVDAGLARADLDAGTGSSTGCVSDQDCASGGRCVGVLLQTFCQDDSTCNADADCDAGRACLCGSGGDKLCFAVDCRADRDCPASQSCFRANPCNYGPYGDYRCTTPEDECVPYQSQACGCDFDGDQRRWICRPIICD